MLLVPWFYESEMKKLCYTLLRIIHTLSVNITPKSWIEVYCSSTMRLSHSCLLPLGPASLSSFHPLHPIHPITACALSLCYVSSHSKVMLFLIVLLDHLTGTLHHPNSTFHQRTQDFLPGPAQRQFTQCKLLRLTTHFPCGSAFLSHDNTVLANPETANVWNQVPERNVFKPQPSFWLCKLANHKAFDSSNYANAHASASQCISL